MPASILVVDDDPLAAAALGRYVSVLGHAVAHRASARDAIEYALRHRPDLVLMDVGLGEDDMDGIAAAQAIRAQHDVPIVFLTMRTDADTMSRAERLDRAAYLQKSCSEQELRFTIESLLEEAGAGSA